jgi:hypothetical protein
MDATKSLDEYCLIAALLADAHASYGVVFDTRALSLTLKYVEHRVRSEGVGFLTKALPRLGKHLDQVLAGATELNCAELEFALLPDSKLPRFLGELFSLVFQPDGKLLPDPDANCVRLIRDILYCFYKYELPYDEVQEQQVVDAFKQAEADLAEMSPQFAIWHSGWHSINKRRHIKGPLCDNESYREDTEVRQSLVIREAKRLLIELFRSFDPTDIIPRHGPGVVATKQRLSKKYLWTNVSSRITDLYPFDAYFCASLGHVCDTFHTFDGVDVTDQPAQVLLVPKDSRGPRLISCEPVDNQWIQQGLSRAIYRLVEGHPLTKWNVFFTDQGPNGRGALLGSSTGRYATLDLKEASDRVHLELVRLLFPMGLLPYLECCRSTSTVLPDGEVLRLLKFAPMGSALCFPIMALTIWSLLTAAAPNADTRERILVYGDDVIVPTAYAGSAMAILEEFGLKINRSKSCVQGFFRESCGVDAFKGVDVTPVRIRTVWNSSPRPDVYSSWISYANAYWDRRYLCSHEFIVGHLQSIYGPVPSQDLFNEVEAPENAEWVARPTPCLKGIPADKHLFRSRFNKHLQKVQYKVRVIKSPSVHQELPGWSKLLRYFSEAQRPPVVLDEESGVFKHPLRDLEPFSVGRYTKRGTSILVQRWR